MNRFFLLLGLGMCTLATAQFPYSASVFEETYTPLTNPVSLGIDVGWDDPEVEIPLPFEVSIGEDDDIVTVLQISGTGEMLMGLSASAALNILWPISLDVMDIGAVEIEEESHIQYEVTGTSPNRILKVEWDEVGLYEEISELGTTTMRLSFQTWLYENGNIIEYRFGPNTMGDGSLDSEFLTSGLILDFDYDYYSGLIYTANGDPATPEWSLTDDFYAWYYSGQMLNGVPEDGTVYRFGPATNIAESSSDEHAILSLYPNPADGQCWMENQHNDLLTVTLWDAQGRSVSEVQLNQGQRVTLDVTSWESGFYAVQALQEDGSVHMQRLIIR